MHSYFVILRYELFLLFISPASYVSTFYFLSLIAVGFRYFIESFIFTDWILPPLSSLTIAIFFGSPAFVPFITMRCFSEERKLGTLETLYAAPINFISLVLGKWTACYILFLIITLLSFCFPVLLCILFPEQGENLGFFTRGAWIGNLSFIISYGATFTAIGVFSSAVTKNQMVAGMLTFTLLTIFLSMMTFNFKSDTSHYYSAKFDQILLACFDFLKNGLSKLEFFSSGIIEIKTILNQVSITLFFLILTVIQIERLNK